MRLPQFRLLIVVTVATLAFMCLSCASGPQPANPTSTTVVDGLGRQVTLPPKVERVATNYPIALHFIYALGAQDKLVGMDFPSQSSEFFPKLDPKFKDIPVVGSPAEINLEEVLALKADLVLLPGRNREMVERVSERGIAAFGVVAEDLDQLTNTMDNLGRALGKEAQAKKFIDYYRQTLDMIAAGTKDIPAEEKTRVYLAGPLGALSTCGGDMYQHFLIELAGGINVAAEVKGDGSVQHGWMDISPEQLLQWDPDVIVVVQYSSNNSPEKILADSRWQGVKAVKNKKVFWFPSKLNPWDYPSPQAVLGVIWLAKTLNPDIFPSLDPLREAETFFQDTYGHGFAELGGSL